MPPAGIFSRHLSRPQKGECSMLLTGDGTGALVIGYTLSFVLMGFLTLQTYIYFTRYSTDRKELRAYVCLLFFTELLISIFTFHGFWIGATSGNLLFIINDTNDISVANGNYYTDSNSPAILWSLQALACLTGFVSFITHGFFCWRMWSLTQSLPLPAFVMMASLLQFSMVSYGGIQYGLSPSIYSYDQNTATMEVFTPVWLCGSLLCDTIITVYMTAVLRREGAKSPFQDTKSLTAKLVRLTIETGLVTTVAAVVELILATALRETVWHLAVFYMISKLYANCVLANLNARQGLRLEHISQSLVFANKSQANSGLQPSANQQLKAARIFQNVESDVETNNC
ncbi:hypothetical protein BV22DRAFT_1116491 [Leucogyrophana mollusca]|uniref:Uncharacterized protein n=1 Tax=Leucogyrophana mollusca TaxID=85980 RepID=A0ACB8BZ17_9AGAM|nr:hypothetical protein BV22DRAFT_1116491 [Leucogyrophana mollusca]